jgi:hypothetical protein
MCAISVSGVHIVLSMREQFFYQLDSFRDHIPRIFHKESNLRLRWLSIAAARQVIQQPAEKFGVTFEAEVIDSILRELAEDGWIEPARLQIVCDTLRDQRRGSVIDSELYNQA